MRTRYPDFRVKEQVLVYTLTIDPKTSTGFKLLECQSILNSLGKIQPEILRYRESFILDFVDGWTSPRFQTTGKATLLNEISLQ